MNFLIPRLGDVARADGKHSLDLQFLFATVRVGIRQQIIQAFDRMAKDVGGKREVEKLLGINPGTLGITHLIDRFRDENILLVENAARDYADSVRKIFDDPSAHLLRVEELKAKLLDRGSISESRAELIARDQTLKLNSQIARVRMERSGVTQFEWSTSGDERVRPEHAELDGKIFTWHDAPFGGPGQSYQCRCIAVPILPELD